MSETLIVQLLVVAAIAGMAAGLLFLVRQKLAGTSQTLAAVVAIGIALVSGLLAMQVLRMGGTAYVVVVLLSAFVGMMAAQVRAWTVESLCRAMALVTGCAALWAAVNVEILAMSTSFGVTGLLSYVASSSRVRSHAEA